MTLTEIQNVVLLFSNPLWSSEDATSTAVIRNITALSSQVAYEERLTTNITTLTTTNADTLNGVIQGLLYVPDISSNAACHRQQYGFIPRNVTRRSNLPPANYNLIAIAPWFSIDCTKAYLARARLDPIRAFIFYKPNNSSDKPQDVDSPVWNLNDDGLWQVRNRYPIFAVSGMEGQAVMEQLSYYSGNISETPHGDDIATLYGPNPNDYVRIWTELSLSNHRNLPALWSFFLIIIGALLLIIACVSFTMHFFQRKRRQSLQRRVEAGEVDLEAMGIKRVTVPATHVKQFPLYTYQSDPDTTSLPPTPAAQEGPPSSRATRPSRRRRRADQRSIASDIVSVGSARTTRSKRSSALGSDTAATNNQPNCHICLDAFEHRVTIIRELSCGHIFHPECIEEFLIKNSSLCPMCKNCMLPAGYSPKITNAMARRERALRRLRERIRIDDESGDAEQGRLKSWGRRLFGLSSPSQSELPLSVIDAPPKPKQKQPSTERRQQNPPAPARETSTPANDNTSESTDPTDQDLESGLARTPPPVVKTAQRRKSRSRVLRTLPTQPENAELNTSRPVGRKSPSSFARERMRSMAASNAPFDDPDRQRPKWRQAIGKVFPGYS